MMSEQSLLIMRARAAWAHDFTAGPSANATFQTLPGFGFTVFGAAPDRDSALASASAEYKLANGVSFLAKFDGQFGNNTQVYAGTGAVRIAW
jgi:outer membrane autotransporter protein